MSHAIQFLPLIRGQAAPVSPVVPVVPVVPGPQGARVQVSVDFTKLSSMSDNGDENEYRNHPTLLRFRGRSLGADNEPCAIEFVYCVGGDEYDGLADAICGVPPHTPMGAMPPWTEAKPAQRSEQRQSKQEKPRAGSSGQSRQRSTSSSDTSAQHSARYTPRRGKRSRARQRAGPSPGRGQTRQSRGQRTRGPSR